MFENIGNKIKEAAKILFWLLIITSIIASLLMFAAANDSYRYEEEYMGLGFAFLLGVPLLSLVISWLLYGFGELIEKVTAIAEKISPIEANKETNPETSSQSNLSEKASETEPISSNTNETNISKTTDLSVLEDLLNRKLISEKEYYELLHKI